MLLVFKSVLLKVLKLGVVLSVFWRVSFYLDSLIILLNELSQIESFWKEGSREIEKVRWSVVNLFFFSNIFAFVQKQTAFLADSLYSVCFFNPFLVITKKRSNHCTDSATIENNYKVSLKFMLVFQGGSCIVGWNPFCAKYRPRIAIWCYMWKMWRYVWSQKNSQSGKSSGTCGHIQTLQIINCPSIFFYTNTSSSKTLHVAHIFKYISS